MATVTTIGRYLDDLLRTREVPDYPNALNGIQLENHGEITHIAAAVDYSHRVIEQVIDIGANFLIVHHGMFWQGLGPITGQTYTRIAPLIRHNVAVYSSHLPLDAHPVYGNNALLARELGLDPSGGFARYQTVDVGIRGSSDIATTELIKRASALAKRHSGDIITTANVSPSRVTSRWAICTGAGADLKTIREAQDYGVDTLIVGEGPHYSAVEAADIGLVIIYAGHYATETFGVQAVSTHIAERFSIPWTFIEAPTGL